MLESSFQEEIIDALYDIFDSCIVLKNDTGYIQGFPDLLVLYKNNWAVLECKISKDAPYRPNQEYYIDKCNKMSFGSMICPENKKEVLYELQRAFSSRRPTRVSRC